MVYYNEFDKKAAAWLRELIKEGLIADGIVDERSITEVKPNELTEFTQCHFFAGIGGWSYALRLAGWPDDEPVWTGSCPCQPFSTAGKGLGQEDSRHLWPIFFNLIKKRRPNTVIGEQVAAAIGKGWLDGISTDLEGESYACGSVVLGAHSLNSPHIRQRLYWVADSCGPGARWDAGSTSCQEKGLRSKGIRMGCEAVTHLSLAVQLIDGWATPTANKLTPQSRDNRCLARDCFVAGWATPQVFDSQNDGETERIEVQGERQERTEQQQGPRHNGQLSGRTEGLGGDSHWGSHVI